MSEQKKSGGEGFKSIYGFIMTAIGFAIGIGSLWKFPYVVGNNGGAVFLFCYIVLILVIGVPLLTAEFAIGFKTQKTAVFAYKELAPGKKWYLGGYLHIIAATLLIGYVTPVYAWLLKYIVSTPMGVFNGMDSGEIANFFNTFSADAVQTAIFGIINFLLVVLVIQGGLQNGVEKINKILLPSLGVIMVVVTIAGLTRPGAMAGVVFLFKPSLEAFTMDSFVQCLGLMFFAVGIAMLASMVFGSYIKDPKTNLFKNATIISSALAMAGVLAGIMIFPLVFANGLEPSSGPGLTFVTMPNVFNVIPFGSLIGTIFYIGFYMAAFTSSVRVVEALVAVYMEHFRVSRRKALLFALTPCVIISAATIAVPNLALFNLLDMIENNYILILGGLVISIFCGWVWKIENCMDAANIQNPFIRKWMSVSVKYLAPIVIVIIFVSQYF